MTEGIDDRAIFSSFASLRAVGRRGFPGSRSEPLPDDGHDGRMR
ncbi:hypothetical protein BMA10247_2781 [Burkholderia mallei NCTC 10247]|nr:hypothetical protein BMASAVP1_A3223 [Burkholderia mallei SAVP1]ABN82656.1 hypothetical protein BURPS668_3682 [Burkholderia pseudomallei 668]ABO04233.1 hypothetical protein BMA10247_2781 [Burkholderia mallei NCTC 10247]ACQ96734.1 conserved hypothetical protein [Burkholderia pseudomallei MSHR346]EBA45547.1 hypothetical protein BURPS305_1954 [Burkholderia pseudomallei 305]